MSNFQNKTKRASEELELAEQIQNEVQETISIMIEIMVKEGKTPNYQDLWDTAIYVRLAKLQSQIDAVTLSMQAGYEQGAMDERYRDNWISINNRLPSFEDTSPEYDFNVWAYNNIYNQVELTGYTYLDNGVYTHWQPIRKPQAPKN